MDDGPKKPMKIMDLHLWIYGRFLDDHCQS